MHDERKPEISDADLGRDHVAFVRALRTGVSPGGRPCPRFGPANPSPETPNALVREILANIQTCAGIDPAACKAAVLFTAEFAAEIMRRRGSGIMSRLSRAMGSVTVMTAKHCPATEALCADAGTGYGSIDEFARHKYDIVLGNPPFDDASSTSSSSKQWPYFYQIGFRMLAPGGVMAMVTPQTWMAPKGDGSRSPASKVRDIIAGHAVCINAGECRRHFEGVGSTFCYSIVTKAPSSSCRVITDEHDFVANPAELCELMTRDVSPASMSIMRKFKQIPKRAKAKSRTPTGKFADAPSPEMPHEVWYCRNTIRWSDTGHEYERVPKLIWHNQTTSNLPVFDDGKRVPGIRGAVFPVRDAAEADSIIGFLSTAPMRYIVSQQRFHHGFLNTAVVSGSIPDLDYAGHAGKPWTDAEVAGIIGLSDAEVDEIWAVLDD